MLRKLTFFLLLISGIAFAQDKQPLRLYVSGSINNYHNFSNQVDGIVSNSFPLSIEFNYNPRLSIGAMVYTGFFHTSVLTDRKYRGGQFNGGISHRINLKSTDVFGVYQLTHVVYGNYDVSYKVDQKRHTIYSQGYQVGLLLGAYHMMMSDYGKPLNVGFFIQTGFYQLNYTVSEYQIDNIEAPAGHINYDPIKALNFTISLGVKVNLTKSKDNYKF